MYYHQTSHGQCGHPRLSYHSKESVTFDLISRSRDPIWPPNTFCNPNFTPKNSCISVIFGSISIKFFFYFVSGDQFHTFSNKTIKGVT